MMKSFAQILDKSPDIVSILAGHERYWAHIHDSKKEELLSEHVHLVNSYAKKLVEVHGLDNAINSLLTEYTKDWEDSIQCVSILKDCFVGIVVFHDFGKVNDNFQFFRMNNRNNFKENKNVLLRPTYGHSKLSAFLFISYYLDYIYNQNISDRSKTLVAAHCFILSYNIMQHHSPALYCITEADGYLKSFQRIFPMLRKFIDEYGWYLDENRVSMVMDRIDHVWRSVVNEARPYEPFPFYTLIKLNFSLLTAADYLATHHYSSSSEGGSEGETTDFGVFIERQRVSEIAAHLQSLPHNKSAYSKVEGYKFVHPTIRSNDNLNKLREEMAIEVIQNIRSHASDNLFYLEAPTGGGKTNLSAIVATELLMANPELNKIYYVFPFTTLITQTFASLKASAGLFDGEIAELHSKAASASKNQQNLENERDGLYFSNVSDEKKDYIDNLFALYPVTLLSHVRFFDILKTNRKEMNYLLHRLANSVVVIDELQSYNPRIWDKMLFLIDEYARHFNIRFLLMSATLPKISGLKTGMREGVDFVELLPNARDYIVNPNFSERVSFNFELFEEGEIKMEQLAEAVLSKSAAYAEMNGKVKVIVEFIYKQSAADFLKEVQNAKLFDRIFLLSGTVLEPRRKFIINYIKQDIGDENILLITTQVVEAGVDIDMDLGFKNISLIDSDEQLAGRVNRNAKKDNCEVYIFKMDSSHVLYGSDYRYKKTYEEIDTETYKTILKEKKYSLLYNKVLGFIDENNSPLFKGSIQGYMDALFHFNYPMVDRDFKIIEQDSASVFVPLDLPIYINGSKSGEQEQVFNSAALAFLEAAKIFPDNNGSISGKSVWDLYKSQIERRAKNSRSGHFDISLKIDFKQLNSIMSKFTFSLLQFGKDYQELKLFGEEQYGYLYLHNWNENVVDEQPYTYEGGLNNEVFKHSNFI